MSKNEMNLSFEELYSTLKQQFYVNVPFHMDATLLFDAVQAFFKFLDEPEAVKSQIDFSIAPKHRRGDIGFKHRDSNDHLYDDSKDFFHYHPAIFEKYENFLNANPVVNDFMLKAKPVWEITYQAIQKILKTFEPNFPETCSKIFNTPYPHLMLRFLKYDWQSSGKYLAKPHFDAGSFSLAIAESCPGLRIGSCPENLKLVEHKPGQAVFMLSSNFKKVINSDELSAGWHDVIQLDDQWIGKPFARWAVVAFIEAHGVEALPRTETHKWYTKAE